MAPKRKAKRRAKPGPGRPTKLTEETRKTILDAIKAGLPLERAAALGGVHGASFFQWVQRGRGEHTRPTRPEYVEFAEAVTRARAQAESEALSEIRAGVMVSGAPDWKARLEWLRATRPEQYSETALARARLDAEIDDMLDNLKSGLSADEYRRALQAMSGQGTGG